MSVFSNFFHALRDLVDHGANAAESTSLSLVTRVEAEIDAKIAAALRPLVERLDKMEANLTGNPLMPSAPSAPSAPPQAVA